MQRKTMKNNAVQWNIIQRGTTQNTTRYLFEFNLFHYLRRPYCFRISKSHSRYYKNKSLLRFYSSLQY